MSAMRCPLASVPSYLSVELSELKAKLVSRPKRAEVPVTCDVQMVVEFYGQPVAEIKQISAYSCRGMNGQAGARISEHAFGNALDIAAFVLADGRKITVKGGWKGLPEEQGFLRDVQGASAAGRTIRDLVGIGLEVVDGLNPATGVVGRVVHRIKALREQV